MGAVTMFIALIFTTFRDGPAALPHREPVGQPVQLESQVGGKRLVWQ